MSTYLQFKSLTKRYGATMALRDLNLEIRRGNVLALLGPNGAGKSTLFGCLLGFTRPTGGEILFQKELITDTDCGRFGYVSERVALYPQCSVWENGIYFARLKNTDRVDLERQLKRVGLYAVRERKVRQLSKGMLQRLGLAIALCGKPEILVLDEPFNGLDPALLENLQQILREENQRGATLLISTHTISAVEPLATHVAVLLEGRLAAFGTTGELRANFQSEASLEQIYHRIARQRSRSMASEVEV